MDTTLNNQVIRLYGAVPDSIVDGPGLRYAVFVQGCTHGCPGCHNPESQSCTGGTETTVGAVLKDIRANGLVHAVTLSGGEPFEQARACSALAGELKAQGYNVWAYTGYLYEDLLRIVADAGSAQAGAKGGLMALDAQGVRDLLDAIDVLVDGPFVEARKSFELKWRGSSNQRVIDMAATRREGHVVLWQVEPFSLDKPASW